MYFLAALAGIRCHGYGPLHTRSGRAGKHLYYINAFGALAVGSPQCVPRFGLLQGQ
jgi:hypothetical protein